MITMTETRLPDFEEMLKIATDIEYLTLQKLTLEVSISEREAESISWSMENTKVNGKPPSMEYLKLTIKPIGKDDNLIGPRIELAKVKSELEGKKLLFDVYKAMIGVWQTESANKRAVSL